MSKDPAFLFYSSDFLTGTMTMSDEQVGKYIRLLCLQHQQGRLTEEDMNNICKTYDERIFKKFDKDDIGYFNKRLDDEIIRRRKYSESRSKNRTGKKSKNISKTYDKHMETETETENKRKKKVFVPPLIEEVKDYFKENGYEELLAIKFFNSYNVADWVDSKGNKIRNWKQKAIQVWFKDEYKIVRSISNHIKTKILQYNGKRKEWPADDIENGKKIFARENGDFNPELVEII